MKKYINIWTSISFALLVGFIGFTLYVNREQPNEETPDTLYEEQSKTSPKRSATITQVEITDPENIQNLLDSLEQIYVGDPE